MELKKCRTCVGCQAYNEQGRDRAYCILGFDTIDLDKGQRHVGRYKSNPDYYLFICKPAEPCYKPMSFRAYVEAFKLVHNIKDQ